MRASQVLTFRAPPNYKRRITERAHAEHTTESQVICVTVDVYLYGAHAKCSGDLPA